MISLNEIKFIRSLSLKKNREEYGLFVVEGEKMVNEALKSSFDVKSVYRIEEIGEEAMSRISSLSSPSPALAVVRIPLFSSCEEKNIISKKPLAIALDSVRDPGNLGNIIRIADWFGIDAVFASEDSADIFNPKVIQATMGAIFRKKVIYCKLTDIVTSFVKSELPVYGTFLEGDNIYSEKLGKEGLIVIGSEANGISPEVEHLIEKKLFIPPFGSGENCESLNVASATAIVLSEFRRR